MEWLGCSTLQALLHLILRYHLREYASGYTHDVHDMKLEGYTPAAVPPPLSRAARLPPSVPGPVAVPLHAWTSKDSRAAGQASSAIQFLVLGENSGFHLLNDRPSAVLPCKQLCLSSLGASRPR